MNDRIASSIVIIFFAVISQFAHSEPAAPPNSTTPTEIVGMSTKVDAYSVANLTIGMSEEEIKQHFPQLSFQDRGPIRQAASFVQIPEFSDDVLPEAQGNEILELTTVENRLVNISIRWLPVSFDSMSTKLTRELGPPVSAETSQNVTASGERLSNTISLWVGERAVVRHFQHYEDIKQSRLLVMERTKK